MAQTLYLECSSGISGDMTVAALLDLGTPEEKAERERRVLDVLASLPVRGFEVRVSRVVKSGLDACDFDVVLDEAHENHDHDMAYLYGEDRACVHGHGHEDEHAHDHHHEHRNLSDVLAVIDASNATDGAKGIARKVFDVLAHAEAKAHGKPIDEVHFHEVGAVDSIADVLAFAVCLDDLDVSDVIVTELAEGRGTVRCQHGIIPVPVPAVVNIVGEHDIALRMLDVRGELVTPTGAAFVAAVRTKTHLPDRFVIRSTGLGAGKRVYDTPGVVRAMLIDSLEEA